MRKFLDYLWRVSLATVLLTAISYASWHFFFRSADLPEHAVPPWLLLFWVVLAQLLTIGALAYPIVKSRWSGTQLVAAIFVACFGIKTFVVFGRAALIMPDRLPMPTVALFVAHGFLVGLFHAVVLVVVFGRTGRQGVLRESTRLHLPPSEWVWKLAVCTAALVVASFVRDRFLTPARVREYLAASMSVGLGLRTGVEAARAVLLVAFVLPVIKMLRGDRLDAAMAVALLFAVLGVVSNHLIPWGGTPDDVRIILLLLLGVADFAYGLLVGYLFSRRPMTV